MTGKSHTQDYPEYDLNNPESYEEYISSTPLEARFDPATIQIMVVEAIQKHAAYEMQFDEYLRQRSRFSEYDESEKKRLSFYLPLFPAMRSQDFAYEYEISLNKFLVNLVELGLITFLYDYHGDCSETKRAKHELSKAITSERTKILYLQVDKQKINLGSTVGSRDGISKHFSPGVQEWFYNAINDAAAYLNMTTSDLAYLCWCIGVQKTLKQDIIDKMLDKDIDNVMQLFRYELEIYLNRINSLLKDVAEK